MEPGGDLIEQCGEPLAYRPAARGAKKPFNRGVNRLEQNLAHGLRVVPGGPGPKAVFLFGGQL